MRNSTWILVVVLLFSSCRKNDCEAPKPKADFTYEIDPSGKFPTEVHFTSMSANGRTYSWTFGDGQTSIEENPVHQYRQPGNYIVQLVVTGPGGRDRISKTVCITDARSEPIINSVLVYLITPRDNQFNPAYFTALKNATLNLQEWYKSQMVDNKTFVLNPWIVDTLTGLHDSTWYYSNNGDISGTDPRFYGFYNTMNDLQEQLGSSFNTTDYVYFVYVASPGGGAGIPGFCAMGDQDLKGLLGENPENLNPNRWIGGGGHELGHAFGLPHPANENGLALMWTGYLIYPDCILQQEDKDLLNSSPFFR